MIFQRRSEKLNSFRSSSVACCKLRPSESVTEKTLTHLGGHSKDHLVPRRRPRLSLLHHSSNFLPTNYDHERQVLEQYQFDNSIDCRSLVKINSEYKCNRTITRAFVVYPCRCHFIYINVLGEFCGGHIGCWCRSRRCGQLG